MPSYVGSGGITLSGCAKVRVTEAVTIKFPINGTFYNCAAARRGCLEAITIKRYHIVKNKASFNNTIVMYIDTLNGLWNEEDICTKAEAVAAALAQCNRKIELLAAAKRACLID